MATCVPKRSLILTLDAFGTLIKPRKPISLQYREEAEKFGLPILSQKEAELEFSFKKACVRLNNVHPNNGGQGSKRRIGFREWWAAAITETLTPFSAGKSIPQELIDSLIKRFSSSDGYELYPDVLPFLQQISKTASWRFPPAVTISQNTPRNEIPEKVTVLGILSNGDPRIPLILESLDVAPYFSFHVLAYDHGVAKPAREIFRIARLEGLRVVNPGIDTRDPETKEEVASKWKGFEFIHVGDDVFEDWIAARKLKDISPIWLDRRGLGLNSGNAGKFQKSSLPTQLPPVIYRALGREWALMSNKARARLDPNRQLEVSTVKELPQIVDLFPALDPKDEAEYYDQLYEEVRSEKDRLESLRLGKSKYGRGEADAQAVRGKDQVRSRRWGEAAREQVHTELPREERQSGSRGWGRPDEEVTGKIRRLHLGYGDEADKEGARPSRWKEHITDRGGWEKPNTDRGGWEKPNTDRGGWEKPNTGRGGWEKPTTDRGSWEKPAHPGAWGESIKRVQRERPRRWNESEEDLNMEKPVRLGMRNEPDEDIEEPVPPRRRNQSTESATQEKEFRPRRWSELAGNAFRGRESRSHGWNESNENENMEKQVHPGKWDEPTDRLRSERQADPRWREFSEGRNQMGPRRWGERNDTTRQTPWRNEMGPSRWGERNDNMGQAGSAWRDRFTNGRDDGPRWRRPEPGRKQAQDMDIHPSEIERIHRELSFKSRPWPEKKDGAVPEQNERRVYARNLMEKYPDGEVKPEAEMKPRDESQSRY